jgi:flagellar basal body-associated protein FliL
MTDASEESTPATKSRWMGSLLLAAVVGIVSGGLGFGIPIMFPSIVGGEPAPPEEPKPVVFVAPFGSVVVNLNESRMNRYLRLQVALRAEGDEGFQAHFNETLEPQKPLLTSWLIGHLADLSMEDIRGAAGQNKLRREIQDHFNTILFPDGHDHIIDVLFEEFNVQ